jgi:hypothetical protein
MSVQPSQFCPVVRNENFGIAMLAVWADEIGHCGGIALPFLIGLELSLTTEAISHA